MVKVKARQTTDASGMRRQLSPAADIALVLARQPCAASSGLMQCGKKPAFCSATQAGHFDPRALGQPAMRSHWVPLESLAHLTIADPIADGANITGDLMLAALFDRLRALAEHGDGFTIVPRAEPFGSTIHDLAQPIPGTATIIDPCES
jgi:hypothetical protein